MNDNFEILPKIFVCDLRLEGPVIAGAQAWGQGVKGMPLVPLETGPGVYSLWNFSQEPLGNPKETGT